MQKREFYRLMAKEFNTPASYQSGLAEMRAQGLIQDRIQITASASAKVNYVRNKS